MTQIPHVPEKSEQEKPITPQDRASLVAIIDFLEGKRHDDPQFRDILKSELDLEGKQRGIVTGGPEMFKRIANQIMSKYAVRDWSSPNANNIRQFLGMEIPVQETPSANVGRSIFGRIKGLFGG
ncbi:hypothetical protein EXS70_04230 [Candidatus Peribacteria bacterium]|nr:hypothetical protein [Candidatus Peribacteria bacterium]